MLKFDSFYFQCPHCQAWLEGRNLKAELVNQAILYSDGKVLKWENKPSKLRNSHMFKHDCDVSLSNISILYKNMYL